MRFTEGKICEANPQRKVYHLRFGQEGGTHRRTHTDTHMSYTQHTHTHTHTQHTHTYIQHTQYTDTQHTHSTPPHTTQPTPHTILIRFTEEGKYAKLIPLGRFTIYASDRKVANFS